MDYVSLPRFWKDICDVTEETFMSLYVSIKEYSQNIKINDIFKLINKNEKF
ncbi:MAG TPA: hypothetical protein VLG50_05250 [Candidatus Saccharimonadales bacterium]|nr:hypothetical protein [Candidatus Saccharimonadales bacterium]